MIDRIKQFKKLVKNLQRQYNMPEKTAILEAGFQILNEMENEAQKRAFRRYLRSLQK